MMMPSIFGESLFDDFGFPTFSNVSKELYGKNTKNLMMTDVKELEKGYEVDIELPGFDKQDIKMQLKDGILTVYATKESDKKDEDKNKKFIRRERFSGSVSRSFNVGDHVTEDDIHPKYENGVLSFVVPKKEAKPVEEKKHYITIEG